MRLEHPPEFVLADVAALVEAFGPIPPTLRVTAIHLPHPGRVPPERYLLSLSLRSLSRAGHAACEEWLVSIQLVDPSHLFRVPAPQISKILPLLLSPPSPVHVQFLLLLFSPQLQPYTFF